MAEYLLNKLHLQRVNISKKKKLLKQKTIKKQNISFYLKKESLY